MSAHAIDMTGQTVGRRTVLGRAPWGMRAEIAAALDGGRRTLRGAA